MNQTKLGTLYETLINILIGAGVARTIPDTDIPTVWDTCNNRLLT